MGKAIVAMGIVAGLLIAIGTTFAISAWSIPTGDKVAMGAMVVGILIAAAVGIAWLVTATENTAGVVDEARIVLGLWLRSVSSRPGV